MVKHIRVHTDFDAQNPTYSEKYSVFQVQFLGSWPFNTTDGHPDTQYLTDPPFHSSVHKSAKQSIVFDVPKLSNDLEENTRSTTFTACFRNSSKVTYLHSAPPPRVLCDVTWLSKWTNSCSMCLCIVVPSNF